MINETLVVIPTRLAATRLPNKPILPIAGKSMIRHVVERVKLSGFSNILVASGDQQIIDNIEDLGVSAVLTDPQIPSGTDRVCAAANIFDPERKFKNIVNLQGDMPNFDPNIIRECTEVLIKSGFDISTLCSETTEDDAKKSSVVKPVFGAFNANFAQAFYFSRAIVPFYTQKFYHHLGIYAFRRESLDKFVSLKPSKMELEEKLEQLRAIENGMKIAIGLTKHVPISVDTPEDLQLAQRVLTNG